MRSLTARPTNVATSMTDQNRMQRNEKRSITIAAALLFVVACALPAAAYPPAFLNPNAKDVDKLHDLGNWFRNYWDDVNENGQWEPNEPIADAIDPSWSHPMEGGDGTCWVTVAANLLAQSGYQHGDADAIYWDILLNMEIPAFPDYDGDPNSPYGANWWVVGGWQQDAINWYLTNRSDPFLESTLTVYYSDYPPDMLDFPWIDNPFDVAAEALSSGKQVGIVLYGDDIWHDVTFQGYDVTNQTLWITDSERDLFGNDLNQYAFDLTGPTGWNISYTGHGNVAMDMLVILDTKVVPEPATFGLVGLGLTGIAMFARKRARQK